MIEPTLAFPDGDDRSLLPSHGIDCRIDPEVLAYGCRREPQQAAICDGGNPLSATGRDISTSLLADEGHSDAEN